MSFILGSTRNVITEDIVHMCNEMGIITGIDIDKVILIVKKVENLAGHKLYGYVMILGKNSDLLKSKKG